jgi:chromate reductase
VLKNAIDWVSRPAYRSVLAHKPVTLLGASPGAVGTARAQGQLKQVLSGTLSPLFPHPEIAVGGSGSKFDALGRLTDDRTREQLRTFMKEFSTWVERERSGALG